MGDSYHAINNEKKSSMLHPYACYDFDKVTIAHLHDLYRNQLKKWVKCSTIHHIIDFIVVGAVEANKRNPQHKGSFKLRID